MHFYSSSPLSLGYISRASYRPAPVFTYPDDESSFIFEGLGYPAHTDTFPPRLDAETRYRRAVHELQAAEEEFKAHLTLRRAQQAAVIREQTARRDRALAIQAEVERIGHARALQVRVAEEYGLHQRAHRAQAALDRARRQRNALLHGFVDASPRDVCASERPCAFAKKRRTHPEPAHRHLLRDTDVVTFDGLLKLISGTHPQFQSQLRQSSSPAPPQPRSIERQPSEEQDLAADAVNAVLEFLHGLATHSKNAANESETISKPNPVPQSQASSADEEGKGKAKTERAEPATGPTLFHALLGALTQGPSYQESKDIELAIQLSLEDPNAADTKKTGAAKAVRFTSGSSSTRVKLDGAVPRSNIPSSTSDTASSTSKPITRPVPQPVSPLTTIRAVRNRLFALESAFPLPAIDYDQSVFPAPPSIAPLRAYENTLNGLLEQLDAIDSDGNEEVRSTRREAVREVEKALDDLERKASKSAPKREAGKNVEVKGYGVEPEALAATAAQDAVVVKATFVAEGAETTKPFAAEDTSSLDADEIAQVLRDSSEPIAMSKVTPASGSSSDVYVPTLPVAETFLASKPHDQFTFPLKPSYSDSGASSAGVQDDVVLVTNPEEGESVKSGEDGWSQVDA